MGIAPDPAGIGRILAPAPGTSSVPRPLALLPALVATLAATAALAGGVLPPELCTIEVRGRGGVVVANTQEAAEAGARMLREGGNAIDAAVAASFALGVSETEASGLGGNAWMLIHLASGRDVAIDGSPAVPLLVGAVRDGRGLPEPEASGGYGYWTVAAPGSLAVDQLALERYGTKRLADTLAPAIELAEAGVRSVPHTQAVLEEFAPKMRASETLARVFLDAGLDPWGPSHLFCLDDLARTLRRLARVGARDFYAGAIADRIDADMRAHGGFLRKYDLTRFRAVERAPLRGRYRGLEVVSFPAPGGGAALIEALQVLACFPGELLAADGVARAMLTVEATRLAIADFSQHVPSSLGTDLAMISPEQARSRAGLIRLDRAMGVRELGLVHPPRQGGTTHLSVVDAQGNAVALTQSCNSEFGACVATPGLGFPYNAALKLFDWQDPASASFPRPDSVLPYTCAPTIVLRAGRPLLVLGSPGSARITGAILDVVVNLVDRGMSLAAAVAAPRVIWDEVGPPPRVLVEMAGTDCDLQVSGLRHRGLADFFRLEFPTTTNDIIVFGGVNSAGIDPRTGETVGAGDPRRGGAAAAGLATAP
jgi:gamma-glutamyltranspeptidase / glutathione hydrolase